jgi:hypothetical protein
LTTLLARLLSTAALLAAALSWLLVLLARLLPATLLAAVATLLTTLVLLARFLFVRVHDCSVVAPQSTTEITAIKFPLGMAPSVQWAMEPKLQYSR